MIHSRDGEGQGGGGGVWGDGGEREGGRGRVLRRGGDVVGGGVGGRWEVKGGVGWGDAEPPPPPHAVTSSFSSLFRRTPWACLSCRERDGASAFVPLVTAVAFHDRRPAVCAARLRFIATSFAGFVLLCSSSSRMIHSLLLS